MKPADLFWKGATLPNVNAVMKEVNLVLLTKKRHLSAVIDRQNFGVKAPTRNCNGSRTSYHESVPHLIVLCRETDSNEDAMAIMLANDVTRLIVRNELGTVTGVVDMEVIICTLLAGNCLC